MALLPANCLQKVDTDYCADSIECCPAIGGEEQVARHVACGTYQLVDADRQLKRGRLYLYEWEPAGNDVESPATTTATTNGFPHRSHAVFHDGDTTQKPYRLLAVAMTGGKTGFYGTIQNEWKLFQEDNDDHDDVLALSLDWSALDTDRISVSMSDGRNRVLRVTHSEIAVERVWQAHSMEAWITAMDRWDRHAVYTGSDDTHWKLWDLRSSDLSKPVYTSKYHSMGVTSIQSHPSREHIVATGSYDERVCIWDRRSLAEPLAEQRVGGGVWRIKWHPRDPPRMVTACMYHGFHTLRWERDNVNTLEVDQSYLGHESLAYGVDWICDNRQGDSSGSDEEAIVSCSFYDHNVQLWQAK